MGSDQSRKICSGVNDPDRPYYRRTSIWTGQRTIQNTGGRPGSTHRQGDLSFGAAGLQVGNRFLGFREWKDSVDGFMAKPQREMVTDYLRLRAFGSFPFATRDFFSTLNPSISIRQTSSYTRSSFGLAHSMAWAG